MQGGCGKVVSTWLRKGGRGDLRSSISASPRRQLPQTAQPQTEIFTGFEASDNNYASV